MVRMGEASEAIPLLESYLLKDPNSKSASQLLGYARKKMVKDEERSARRFREGFKRMRAKAQKEQRAQNKEKKDDPEVDEKDAKRNASECSDGKVAQPSRRGKVPV